MLSLAIPFPKYSRDHGPHLTRRPVRHGAIALDVCEAHSSLGVTLSFKGAVLAWHDMDCLQPAGRDMASSLARFGHVTWYMCCHCMHHGIVDSCHQPTLGRHRNEVM
ncbi:hypothetical protein HAX54_004283 [Datura stramonium]|uniref:Uncharacterized protein n=1 Tax=Datura stramonium TaxID=4076 RepID=A0ABS8T6Q5_DATST|nr:hypothetical protein [Datura stramonium]